MGLRDITIDDVKDLLHMKVDLFGALCLVAGRAKEIHENEEKALLKTQKGKKPITCVLRMPTKGHGDEAGPSRPAPKGCGDEAGPSRPAPKGCGDEAGPSRPAPKRRGDEAGPAPKPKRQRRPPLPPIAEQPPLPAEFHTAIVEIALAKNAAPTVAKLVIQKELYDTDLSSGHNRLSIPFSKIENDFLTDEEKQHLLGKGENGKKRFLEVRIVQPSLVSEETVKLCRWDMPKKNGKTSSTYVIRGNWTAIVKNNKLKLGATVQLWCFRVDRELCFALVRVSRNCAA
ncbi:B3 domain-containing protein-like protein [Salvia divinorum]|uniref:B3 domain-containing protein-like protein n=1 Tax=Salvia divinorum TaxID=28513 RepID=A0ABD1HKC7_SALDI